MCLGKWSVGFAVRRKFSPVRVYKNIVFLAAFYNALYVFYHSVFYHTDYYGVRKPGLAIQINFLKSTKMPFYFPIIYAF